MAFKMTPQGKKKCPYSKFTNKGLLNSPMKQTTSDQVTANAKEEAAQNLDSAEEKLMKEYFDESTNQDVKLYKKTGTGGDRSWEEAYKIAGEKGCLKPGETLKEYSARAEASKYREERTSRDGGDGDPDPDIAIDEVTQEAEPTSDVIGTNVNTGGYWSYGPRGKTWVETQHRDATKDESKMSSENKHIIGSDTTDDVNLQDIVDEQARIKAENSERISGDETTVKQLSPTRQLMNKYMPKKSMAKQEKIYKTDTKKMVKDYGALPSSSSKDLGIESFAASGSTLPEIVIDSNKNKKSIVKQESKELDTFEINVTKDKAPDGFNKNEKTEGFRIRKDGTREKIGGSRTIAGNF